MQILQRKTTAFWLVTVLIGISVAAAGLGFYVRVIRRPIPPPLEVPQKPSRVYWPIFHTFSADQRAHVLDGDFLIVRTVDRLPNDLKVAFCVLTGMQDFEMANPGEKYQVGDVIVERGLPWRRLFFAGISTGKYFIHYEEGGIAHSYHVAVFTIGSDKKVKFLWGGPGVRDASDLVQLRTMAASGVFKDDQAYAW